MSTILKIIGLLLRIPIGICILAMCLFVKMLVPSAKFDWNDFLDFLKGDYQ